MGSRAPPVLRAVAESAGKPADPHRPIRRCRRGVRLPVLLGTAREERGENQDHAQRCDRADPKDRQIKVRHVGLGDEENPHHAYEERPHEGTDPHAPTGRLGQRAYIDGASRCAPRGVSASSRARRCAGSTQGLLTAIRCPCLVPLGDGLTRGGRVEGGAPACPYGVGKRARLRMRPLRARCARLARSPSV